MILPSVSRCMFMHDVHCRRLLNLAHVELNAIDLAWDTVARFAHVGLPAAFFDDFAHVADDESRHFGKSLDTVSMLCARDTL